MHFFNDQEYCDTLGAATHEDSIYTGTSAFSCCLQ